MSVSGTLRLGDGPNSADRLRGDIYERVGEIDRRNTTPDHVAVEQVFMNKNADSALKLGHARSAAAICATFAAT